MHVHLNKSNISINEINPKIIHSHFFAQGKNFQNGHKLTARYVRDYELEFITFSEGSMIVDDVLHPIYNGDIIFRRPGQYTQGIMPYVSYYISFEMIGNIHRDSNNYNQKIDDEFPFQDYFSNPLLDDIPVITRTNGSTYYHQIFDTIFDNFINPSNASGLLIKASLLQLLFQLYNDNTNIIANNTLPLTPHRATIKKVIGYIHKNLNKSIDLNVLSEIAELSPNYLHRIFSKELGLPINKYIIHTKLCHAQKLLLKTELTIAEIALECGFENIPYFCYLFKKEIKKTPGEYRRTNRFIM